MSSFCQSEIVTLVVGEEKAVFSVHRELLCAQSEYLRGQLKGNFAESKKSIIELKEDPPRAISTFLDWLYKDAITLNRTDLNHSILVPTYIFANRICSETYSNALMDAIRKAHRDYERVMETETVVRLYDSGLQAKQATKFGMQSIVHDMVHYPGEWLEGKNEKYIKGWSGNVEVMVDMQREMWRALGAKPEISPDELTGCVFHEHKAGVKCSPKKRKRGSD